VNQAFTPLNSRFSQAEFEQYLDSGNTCEYPLRLYKALSSDMMLTNIFLFIVAPYIQSRDLCVIDESHNIESTLFNFVDTAITENTVPFFDKISDTIPTENAEKCLEYLNSEEFENTLKQEIQNYKSDISDLKEDEVYLRTEEQKSELRELENKVEQCRKLEIKVERLNELDEDSALEEKHNEQGEFRGVVLKPIYCSDFFERNIAPKASHFLLSSATFSNAKKVLELLGVDRSDVKKVSIQSDFPVENRPVEFKDVTSLKHDLVEDGDMRDMSASILSIMLSVAKEEGIDLSGDEARFNVLVKTPNPYSEDPRVKYRIEENSEWEWFFSQTASSTAQAYGRTTRSKTDWSKFYILDSHFKSFYDRQKHLLPDWFVQAAEKSDLEGVSA